jgi:hypothetical protein
MTAARSTRYVLRTYVGPLILMLAVLAAWQYTLPPYPKNLREPLRAAPQRVNGGVPPWNANENAFRGARNEARRSALRALDQAWSDFCRPPGRRKLLDALNYYFDQRIHQEESYPRRWGEAGRAYIAAQWGTPDDLRIVRLVRETYGRGYLNLFELHGYIAARIVPLVNDMTVTASPCPD